MEKLQKRINDKLRELRKIRMTKDFQSLPEHIKQNYYQALRMLNEIDDFIIINHLIKK